MLAYLGVGTGASDRIALSVLDGGFRVDDDATSRDHQYLILNLHLRGATKDAVLDQRRAIITKFNQATRGGTAVQDWVTLGVQIDGASSMVWWHVVSGEIAEPGGLKALSGNSIGYETDPLVVALRCRKGAFGAPIVDGAVAIAGSDPTLYRAGIPGDMPALVEMVATDESTGGVILHGFGVGSRSMTAMEDADFEPVQSVEATGAGSLDDISDDIGDTFGGSYVSATTGLAWQSMCYVKPTADVLKDAYDLWLRVRDSGAYLDTPTGIAVTGAQGASRRQAVAKDQLASNGTTVTLSLDVATHVGNTLILKIFAGHASSTPSVSSVPAGFTLVESEASARFVALYVYPNAPSLSGDLSVTLSNFYGAEVVFEEWSGLTSSPVDVSASSTTSSVTSHPTGTTGTTAQANAIAITMHLHTVGDVGGYSSGYILAQTAKAQTSLFAGYQGRSYYKTLTAIGTQSATLTTDDSESSVNLIAVLKADAGGSLTNDTYAYRIVALDAVGNQSVASTPITINHSVATGNATQLEWEASSSPVLTGYRVYARKGADSWVYFDTSSTTPEWLHSTMTSPTGTANPPDVGVETAQMRLGLALGEHGQITNTTSVVRPVKGNGVWEWLRVSAESLSPMAVPLSIDQPDYRLVVQIKHPTEGRVIAVDAVVFVPSDEAWFEADVRNETLDALREWVVGTNQGGHSYAFTRDPADASDVSGAHFEGQLTIGPGDTTMVFLFRGENEAAVIEGVSVSAQATIWPRYMWLAGTV